MLDLTAIEKPFGLLDHATKAALQNHGGPWEVFLEGKWRAKSTFTWQPAYTYRVKPQTVKPREWMLWECDEGALHTTPKGWKDKTVRVREVLP